MKKIAALSITICLVLSLLTVNASASYLLQGGNAKWSCSNEPVTQKTVTIVQFSPPLVEILPNGEVYTPDPTYTPAEVTAYAFPVGTTITVSEPGYDYPTFGGEPVPHNGFFITQYSGLNAPVDSVESVGSYTLTITDSKTVYEIYTGTNDGSIIGVNSQLYVTGIETSGSSATTTTNFTDVAVTSPFYQGVQWAVEKGITKGTTSTTFSPSTTCTHNHILTFLWRANGSPAATVENPFDNIDTGTDFGKAALWAYEKGLVSGTTFPGDAPCTRSQTVMYLWKLAGSPKTAIDDKFADVAADADYAQAVSWAVEKGVTQGTGNGTTFSPDATCTRGQIVTFLYRDLAR